MKIIQTKFFLLILLLAGIIVVSLKLIYIQPEGMGMGILKGRVTIGPLCPAEPCLPQPEIYTPRKIIVGLKFGGPDIARLIDINSDGTFNADLRQGTYSVTLSDCVYLGCKNVLPKEVVIEANKTTTLNIDIDTGIR